MLDKDQMNQLIREEVSELLAEMEQALLELEQTPDEMSLVNRVFRAMHTVKGAANMFGFNDVASLTHEVESLFDAVRTGRISVSRRVLDVGLLAKDLTWQLIEEPEDAQVLADKDALLEKIVAISSGSAEAAPEEAAVSGPEQQSVPPDTPAEGSGLAKDLDTPEEASYAIRYSPGGPEMLSLTDPLAALDELCTLGNCIIFTHMEDVDALENLQEDACSIWWEILLTKQPEEADLDRLNDVFIFVDDPDNAQVEPVEDPLAWISEREQFFAAQEDWTGLPVHEALPDVSPEVLPDPVEETAAPSEAPAPPLQPVEPAPAPKKEPASQQGSASAPGPEAAPAPVREIKAAPPQKKTPAAARNSKTKIESSSIRVDAYKLDDMVALVGELVIAQARLSQVVNHFHDPSLQGVVEELELLSNSLRDRTLSMRMLPIGTTFDRFRRLVRDLSQELGKEIRLETLGAETELDKTVIEQLGDPLVHLLRNAIDHGIEIPDERFAKGKKRAGKILLSAEHSGGHVLISIKDDGKGLDRERIAAKGIERGLITDASNMSDKEVFGLIFQPGFSTAEKVTNVSGRGVGMDVVKKNIGQLRGTVEIDSETGAGTTVTVKLPLTLAIIEGLQVRVGKEYFVIPLASVQECVELAQEDIPADKGNPKKIINLRNEIVPYIRLREWFAVPGERPIIEQIIIAGDNTSRTGIVVDEVVGQQQTVIKSLGKIFKDVQEISGATIKGDGTMALILDVPTLIRKVHAERG